jgi:hypothetical protein
MSWTIEIKKKKKQPPLLWGFVTFFPLVHFCWFLVQQMHQEEGSIYFLDAINNQVLLGPAKMTSKPYIKCLDNGWSTLTLIVFFFQLFFQKSQFQIPVQFHA